MNHNNVSIHKTYTPIINCGYNISITITVRSHNHIIRSIKSFQYKGAASYKSQLRSRITHIQHLHGDCKITFGYSYKKPKCRFTLIQEDGYWRLDGYSPLVNHSNIMIDGPYEHNFSNSLLELRKHQGSFVQVATDNTNEVFEMSEESELLITMKYA